MPPSPPPASTAPPPLALPSTAPPPASALHRAAAAAVLHRATADAAVLHHAAAGTVLHRAAAAAAALHRAFQIFSFQTLLKNFGQTETKTEFAGSEFFWMKFGPEFAKTELTEKPKTETEFFGLTERPPLLAGTSCRWAHLSVGIGR
uniref:Uncharacterized protein n=1 Tax=Oryza sativa subsp. japonica TaxID=39947 RepID=Q10HF1_ORYSJ|nr:hypothetical protein LOC_Os03g39390 [Oryza sativa Japonica Group]